jgi:outer membrane receptor protein involved in Fe transport
MIEFRFGQWLSSVDHPNIPIWERIGFKAQNIGQTRAAGFELSFSGEGRIGDVLIRTLGGYTYTMPVNLSEAPEMKDWKTYSKALFSSIGSLDSAKYYHAILPYRNRTTAKWDVEGTLKKVSIGYSFNYYSTYEKIDPFFLVFTPSIKEFFDREGAGYMVHNVRMSYQLTEQSRIAFLVNNFTNQEYATRPTKLDAPRSFNIQLRVMF